jgi:hypothetical protein
MSIKLRLDLPIQVSYCFNYREGLVISVKCSYFRNFSRLCGRQVRERFGEKPVPVGNIEHPFVFALLKGLPSPLTNLVCILVRYRMMQKNGVKKL